MVLGGVILLAVLILAFVDFSRFEPEIEALVSDSLGREFRIDGAFSLDVFPALALSIDDAVLTNADWSAEPSMAEIGHFSAQVSLWSSLSRPIRIEDLRARDIRVVLERDAQGQRNWEFSEPEVSVGAARPSGGDFASPFELAIDLIDGVGEISGMLLQSEKLTVVGKGEIDLNTEELDIEFNTKPRSGLGVSADMFVTPFVKLTGTLAQPGVGANATGLLLSGGAAVLTGGMSFLYQGLLDRATAEADQCERMLEEVGAISEQE